MSKKSYPSFSDETKTEPNTEFAKLIPEDVAKELKVFAFGREADGRVKLASLEPESAAIKDFAKQLFGDKIRLFKATKEEIELVFGNYSKNDGREHDDRQPVVLKPSSNMIELTDSIIESAIGEKASDIHIEPSKLETAVRYRVDGILRKVLSLPRESHAALVSRFKILANLKIDEYRRPQDGRIEMEKFPDASIRISIMPTLYGEKIAMRVLSDSTESHSLKALGFSGEQEEVLLRNLQKPFGMIVTCGPTGSGKTTTLYELVSFINKDGVNISALEDPIESSLHGVNQIQIDNRAGLTFPSGLRALLRQDPDVILIGEIRDSETAVMAADAALTGHLVLTTIHTNNAPSAFTRFLEMKVEDFVVGSIINLVIAQRLVRRLCSCAKEAKLDNALIKKIKGREDVIGALKTMGKSIDDVEKINFMYPKGCARCLQSGYLGRVGIYELLELNRDIHALVLEHASSDRIRESAVKSGFEDMVSDGLKKVFAGITTFDELLRTTRSN